MNIATTFSGIGSPEYASQRVFEEVNNLFACDVDKYAKQSYLENHKVDKFYDDIITTDFNKYKGKIDIFVGGSPCQSFSLAGKRGGFEDTRGTLFFEFARAIKESEPKYFIFENVKGLVSHDKGKTFETILRTFGELDYDITAKILNTKDYGVPQNRERIFIVGVHRSEHSHKKLYKIKGTTLPSKIHNKLAELYEEGAINYWHDYKWADSIPLTRRLKDILEENVDEKYYMSQKMTNYLEGKTRAVKPYDGTQTISPTLCAAYHKTPTDGFYVKEKKIEGDLNQVGQIYDNGQNSQAGRVYDTEGVSTTLSAVAGGGGGKTGLYAVDAQVLKTERTEEGKKLRKQYEAGELECGYSEHRQYVSGKDGISNTLTSVLKDNLILEPTALTERRTEEAKAIRKENLKNGIDFSPRRGKELVPREDGLANTVTSTQTKEQMLIEPQLIQVAKVRENSTNSMSNRVYDTSGLFPTVDTVNAQKIMEPEINVVGNIYPSGGQAGKIVDINGVNSQGVINTYRIRKLTPRECFRLQDFPEDFKFVVSNIQLYKQAGNSMTVAVIEAIMQGIKDSMDGIEYVSEIDVSEIDASNFKNDNTFETPKDMYKNIMDEWI